MRTNNDKPVSFWIDEDGVCIMPFYNEAGRNKHIYKNSNSLYKLRQCYLKSQRNHSFWVQQS